MDIRKSMLVGTWFLVILNLIMGIGSIILLNRMSPAISEIMSENDRSIAACEKMLSILTLPQEDLTDKDKIFFLNAVKITENNITEHGEIAVINDLKELGEKTFHGDSNSRLELIKTINNLSGINREAMERAKNNAYRLGNAGAWGVVFIACLSFICGLFYIRHLNKTILLPLEELHDTLKNIKIDKFRRCTKVDTSAYFNYIFDEVNSLIDKKE